METTSLVKEADKTSTATATVPPFQDPHSPPRKANRRRACLCICLCITLLLLVALGITILVLALTVFKTRRPTATLTSYNVTGVAQRVNILALQFDINVSLALVITAKNPNYFAFRHNPGTLEVMHRGRRVGEGEVAAGKIPARGSEGLKVNVTVESGNFTAYPAQSLSDLIAGRLEFNTTSRVPGRVTLLLGIIKKDVVVKSRCWIAFSVPNLEVLGHRCTSAASN